MTNDDSLDNETRRGRSEAALRAAFGTIDPQITRFPHVLFPSHDSGVRTVAKVVGTPIGIWGNSRPLVDANGGAYLEPPDSRVISDFKLWKLPTNQSYALDRAGTGNQCYTMVIAANTAEETLTEMYDADLGTDEFEYDKCIALLSEWIDRLRWAYVPLQIDAEFAMFVTSFDHRHLLDSLKRELSTCGISPLFEVKEVGGRQEWLGPLYIAGPGE